MIAREHPRSDVVAVRLWPGGGSRDEGSDDRGISDFAAHMDRGTRALERVAASDVHRVARTSLGHPRS
jgi:predicted Zn-dependent peptidase